jgi:ankyrin repeat protein
LKDQVGIAKVLLIHGADINIADNTGGTPLHFAASSGSTKVVKLLLSNGANVNAKDNGGCTPLDVATIEVADLLRHYRAKRGKLSKRNFSRPIEWEGRAPYYN